MILKIDNIEYECIDDNDFYYMNQYYNLKVPKGIEFINRGDIIKIDNKTYKISRIEMPLVFLQNNTYLSLYNLHDEFVQLCKNKKRINRIKSILK